MTIVPGQQTVQTTVTTEGQQPTQPAGQGSPAAAAPVTSEQNKPNLDAPPASTEGANEEETSLLGEAPVDPAAKPNEPAPGSENKGTENKEQTGAPEAYSDFVMPEGVEADPAVIQEFTAVAKDLNLSQEQAQKLVDLQAKSAQAQAAAAQAQWSETVKAWKTETIQSLGANYKKELGYAAKAIDRLAPPELRQLLNETGFGNRKEFVQLCVAAGKLLSEDSFADGKLGGVQEKDAASVLYPNHPNK